MSSCARVAPFPERRTARRRPARHDSTYLGSASEARNFAFTPSRAFRIRQRPPKQCSANHDWPTLEAGGSATTFDCARRLGVVAEDSVTAEQPFAREIAPAVDSAGVRDTNLRLRARVARNNARHMAPLRLNVSSMARQTLEFDRIPPAHRRLAQAKARPMLIEHAVRTALRDAIAWRIGGGVAPNVDAFAAAAVAAARQALDTGTADALERSLTLGPVQSGAKRLSASVLGRRLMSVPASRFVRLSSALDGPDVIVRDRRRRLHAIVLRTNPDALDAGRTATAIANTTPLPGADRLGPLTIHIFCLATGQRYTFEREITHVRDAGTSVRGEGPNVARNRVA